jgi:hypothetical protein
MLPAKRPEVRKDRRSPQLSIIDHVMLALVSLLLP